MKNFKFLLACLGIWVLVGGCKEETGYDYIDPVPPEVWPFGLELKEYETHLYVLGYGEKIPESSEEEYIYLREISEGKYEGSICYDKGDWWMPDFSEKIVSLDVPKEGLPILLSGKFNEEGDLAGPYRFTVYSITAK
ncbi:MAG: hypothetical protein RR346_09710 [Bacteroidales bacterium]